MRILSGVPAGRIIIRRRGGVRKAPSYGRFPQDGAVVDPFLEQAPEVQPMLRATKSQFTTLKKFSMYLGRALR